MELEADVSGMTKASLVLTEELIAATQADGGVPDAEDGAFDDIEEEGDAPDSEEEDEQ